MFSFIVPVDSGVFLTDKSEEYSGKSFATPSKKKGCDQHNRIVAAAGRAAPERIHSKFSSVVIPLALHCTVFFT
jgi:hypothetical protein